MIIERLALWLFDTRYRWTFRGRCGGRLRVTVRARERLSSQSLWAEHCSVLTMVRGYGWVMVACPAEVREMMGGR